MSKNSLNNNEGYLSKDIQTIYKDVGEFNIQMIK